MITPNIFIFIILVCAPARLSAQSLLLEYTYRGFKWEIFEEDVSWFDALDLCKNKATGAGVVPSLAPDQANHYFSQVSGTVSLVIWTGTFLKRNEMKWQTLDGTATDYLPWEPSYPRIDTNKSTGNTLCTTITLERNDTFLNAKMRDRLCKEKDSVKVMCKTDIDECMEKRDGLCPRNTTCANLIGSFMCLEEGETLPEGLGQQQEATVPGEEHHKPASIAVELSIVTAVLMVIIVVWTVIIVRHKQNRPVILQRQPGDTAKDDFVTLSENLNHLEDFSSVDLGDDMELKMKSENVAIEGSISAHYVPSREDFSLATSSGYDTSVSSIPLDSEPYSEPD